MSDLYEVKGNKWKKNGQPHCTLNATEDDAETFLGLFQRTGFVWWDILYNYCTDGAPHEWRFEDDADNSGGYL